MPADDIVLKLEIVPDLNPKADSVAHALNAWVEVLKASAEAIDPDVKLTVELAGVEPGSQMFRLILKTIETGAERVSDGGKEYPLIFKAAMSLGGLIAGSAIGVVFTSAISPDPRIPADQMAVFESMNKKMGESVELQRRSAAFYGIMQDDPAFDAVKVLRGSDRKPVYEVPRQEFAARSGLWNGGSTDATPRTEQRTATWDVILLKPALTAKPRRWVFVRDGLPFSALMQDQNVLNAIHDRTYSVHVWEGVAMKLEVAYSEKFDGKTWIPVSGSYRVKRVISPAPPLPSLPMFTPAGDP